MENIIEELLSAIQNKDYNLVFVLTEKLSDLSYRDVNDLDIIIDSLPLIVKNFSGAKTYDTNNEKITWCDFEHLIWGIGEQFRQILIKQKSLRKNNDLINRIEGVALNPLFGKGRESFIMLLGKLGSRETENTLIKLLDDKEIQGHAVYALRIRGNPDVKEKIRPFLSFRLTWVRNEAKKYFLKIEK